MNKKYEKSITITASILLVLLLFSSNFFLTFFNRSFYNSQFEAQGTYDEFGVEGTRNLMDNLINYLISENTEIDEIRQLTIFFPEEQAHLKDVSRIVSWVKYLAILFVIGFIGILLWIGKKDLMKSLKQILNLGSISTIAIIILIFLLSLKFIPFFEAFHKIIFPQGGYVFPQQYLLIRLFPQSFFQNFLTRMLVQTGIVSVVLLMISKFIRVKEKRKKKEKKQINKEKTK